MPYYSKCEATKCVGEDASAEKVPCSASFANLDIEKCRKSVHVGCCVDFLLKTNIDKLSDADHDFLVVCSKRCYNKVNRFLQFPAGKGGNNKKRKRRLLGESDDGAATPEGIVLMDWLTTAGNYEQYRESSCFKKGEIALQIIKLMETEGNASKGIVSMTDVMREISALEGEWRVAHDYLRANSNDDQKEEDEEKLREEATTRCKCYYELSPVFLPTLLTSAANNNESNDPPRLHSILPLGPPNPPHLSNSFTPIQPKATTTGAAAAPASLTAATSLAMAPSADNNAVNEEQKTILLEKWKNEEELKYLRNKAKSQEIRLQRDKMMLKKELLLTRLELQQRGVDQETIDLMFPLSNNIKDDDDDDRAVVDNTRETHTQEEEEESLLLIPDQEAETNKSISHVKEEEEDESLNDLEEKH